MRRIAGRQLFLAAALLFVAAQLLALSVLFARFADSTLRSPDVTASLAWPWPPFTMTYRDTRRGVGVGGVDETRVYRVDYTDRRHFRVTLLENQTMPRAVGFTTIVDGHRVLTHDPAGQDTVSEVTTDTYQPAPADWLVPGAISQMLAQRGYELRLLGDGLATLVHDVPMARHREEITFRQDAQIPLRMVETTDGIEVRRVEVLSLMVNGRP